MLGPNPMAQNGEKPCMQASRLLLTVLRNVLLHPEQTKYRRLKTTSENVARLLAIDGVCDLLEMLGFVRHDQSYVVEGEPDLVAFQAAVDQLVLTRRRFPSIEAWEIFADQLKLGQPLGRWVRPAAVLCIIFFFLARGWGGGMETATTSC